jgi:UDP-glucuronate 4-epimerase
MANILVTGGAGFIGSHLCETLISQGHKVICVDNFNDYYDPKIKHRNIKSFKENPLFVLYEADTRDKERLNDIFEKENIQKVVHLAAMAGVRYSIEHPQLYFDVNIIGTSNLLELSVKHNILKFVFGSSSSVYGNNPNLPLNESFDRSPLCPYASSKLMGEDICKFFSDYNNLSIICLRFFTVYGPKGRPDMAVLKFFEALHNGSKITVYGGGLIGRDFTYVGDIVNGIIASLDLDKMFEIINIGKGNENTVNDLLLALEKYTMKKANVIYAPLNNSEATHTLADIRKAKDLLNFNPEVSLDEGIKRFVEWYNEVIKNEEK